VIPDNREVQVGTYILRLSGFVSTIPLHPNSAGKDTLGLNPTTLGGNCVYRRSALLRIGGFPPGAFSEDIEISLAIAAAGWRTGFCPNAVADSIDVHSLRRYWNQRCRWTRGLYRSRKRASGLEGWLVSAGYLDRLVFLAALGLAAGQHVSPLWPAIYCIGPMASIAGALWRAEAGAAVTARSLLSIPPMFAVDVAVSLTATVNAIPGRRQQWRTGGAS
jgi:cellulose synthase/poly-beta-1,6-N-acetylglucosamine synthase-like glycosyltransferase